MDSYYCIVSTTDEPVAELCVLNADTDEAALAQVRAVAEGVAGWAQVSVYAGERVIGRIERAAAMREWPLAA